MTDIGQFQNTVLMLIIVSVFVLIGTVVLVHLYSFLENKKEEQKE